MVEGGGGDASGERREVNTKSPSDRQASPSWRHLFFTYRTSCFHPKRKAVVIMFNVIECTMAMSQENLVSHSY